jgi:hypothetical protein
MAWCSAVTSLKPTIGRGLARDGVVVDASRMRIAP